METCTSTAQIVTVQRRFPDKQGRLEGESISAAESLTPGAAPASYFNWTGDVKLLTIPGAVAHVSLLLTRQRATNCARRLTRKSLISQGTMGRSSHLAPPTRLGEGNVWVVCNPEDPDFGKSVDLRGQSYSLGEHGMADRAFGDFVVGKRRPLITVPSLLSDSGRECTAPVHLSKGVSVLLWNPGEQAGESAEHEDVRLFGFRLTSMGSTGRNGNRSAVQSSPIPLAVAGVSTTRPNCTLDLFPNWERNVCDTVIRLSQFSHHAQHNSTVSLAAHVLDLSGRSSG